MKFKSLTFDAKKAMKGHFKPSTSAERQFVKALMRVARASGHIIDAHVATHDDLDKLLKNDPQLQKELAAYSKKIGPWATRQSAKLLEKVQRSNRLAYQKQSKLLGKAFKENLTDTDIGGVAARLMAEQVALIQSIPLEAGERAQKIAFEAALSGKRAEASQDTIRELQKQLGLSTEVAESRAKLIAVTETARANASINQARAMSVGSTSYRWHNSGDGAVRHSHRVFRGRAMQGQIFRWDAPPTLSDGMTGHPGTFPRCRCFAEPVLD